MGFSLFPLPCTHKKRLKEGHLLLSMILVPQKRKRKVGRVKITSSTYTYLFRCQKFSKKPKKNRTWRGYYIQKKAIPLSWYCKQSSTPISSRASWIIHRHSPEKERWEANEISKLEKNDTNKLKKPKDCGRCVSGYMKIMESACIARYPFVDILSLM